PIYGPLRRRWRRAVESTPPRLRPLERYSRPRRCAVRRRQHPWPRDVNTATENEGPAPEPARKWRPSPPTKPSGSSTSSPREATCQSRLIAAARRPDPSVHRQSQREGGYQEIPFAAQSEGRGGNLLRSSTWRWSNGR